MDKVQYLLGVNKEEVYKTWKALGSLTINENVLYYIASAIPMRLHVSALFP